MLINLDFQAYPIQKHPEWACIQIKAGDTQIRTPIHLCCVIDTSASMTYNNKLNNVKKSLQYLLDFLGPNDTISLVTFSETAQIILNHVAVISSEKENIRTRISVIEIESNTNLSAGIIQSRDTLRIDPRKKQGILLLTDGIANRGLIRPTVLLELVNSIIDKFPGTSISCVGYGVDHNVELLQSISTEGGGSYYVVNNIGDVANVFGNILGGLVSCSFQQVRVVLPIETEVKSRYAIHTTNNKTEIVIGDLSAGMEATFLAKLSSFTPIILLGYNIQTQENIEENTAVLVANTVELQTNGEAHFLRFEVLRLLEKTQKILSVFPLRENTVIELYDRIKECISTITEYRQHQEHFLWDILIDELNTCKRSLQQHTNDIETPTIISQHAGYLGRMRGIPADLSAFPDTIIHSPILRLDRTFSNQTQRQISSELVATVTPLVRQNAIMDPDLGLTTDPTSIESGNSTPIINLSPINSINMPDIPLTNTLSSVINTPFD